MLKKIYPIICFLLPSILANAQRGGHQYYCYTDEVWAEMVHRDSSLLIKRQKVDAAIARASFNKLLPAINSEKSSTTPSVVIPTVFYVVYDTSSVNISMQQIQSQMDQLNENFAPYGYAFCYAKTNVSNGLAFTPQAGDSAGVFRISSPLSNVSTYGTDPELKALSTLPSQNYLRIFIVHSISPEGVLGYTIWPGSSTEQDGIVILYDVCGSNNYCPECQFYPDYNLGAVLTHEAGHFLDLYHTFQGGCDTGSGTEACMTFGDQICDTPPTTGNFGCPSPAPLSCDGLTPVLIQNYMDYTDDPCKNSFTAGQKVRMDFGTNLYHSNLVSEQNLINTGVTCVQLENQYANFYCANYDGCLNQPMTFASLASSGFTYQWDFGDGATATGDTVQHNYTSNGKYLVTLTASSSTLGVTAVNSTPVFVSTCTPIECGVNKLDFNYGFMDFSSGLAVATNHPAEYASFGFALYYLTYYRGDGHGNELFIVGDAPSGQTLYDSLFDSIYHFRWGNGDGVFPVPGNKGEYCFLVGAYDGTGQPVDSELYYIIETNSGALHIRPDREGLFFANCPSSEQILAGVGPAVIPSCDGSKMWILLESDDGSALNVYGMDTNANISLASTYTLPSYGLYFWFKASPNGKKIASPYYNSSNGDVGFVVLDFDKSTGMVTGISTIDQGSSPGYREIPGGVAGTPTFSPNSRFLYAPGPCCTTSSWSTDYVYQYDLYSADPLASRKIVYQYPFDPSGFPSPLYFCFTGPDNKVYIGHQTDPGNSPESYRLSVINNPDVLEDGTGITGFNVNGPDIRPVNCPYNLGLEGFGGFLDRPDAYGCNWQPGIPERFSFRAVSCYNYQFNSDDCFTASWDFGDPASGAENTSTQSAPSHSFSGAGTYAVILTSDGYTFTDTVHISGPSPQIASSPLDNCPTAIANYSVANIQPFVNYIWTITNGIPASVTGQSNINVQWNTADTSGLITLVAVDTITGCADTVYLNTNFKISDSAIITTRYAAICAGSSYMFGSRMLTEAGVYNDTISTSPCLSITRLSLSVNNKPAVAWAGAPDTVSTTSGGIVLSGASPAGGAYSGVGVSDGHFYPDSVHSGQYSITYTYIDSSGCSDSVTRTFVVLTISGINLANEIEIYPNPVRGWVTIQSGLLSNEGVKVQLFDITGRPITVPVQKGSDKQIFNLSSLADGVYLFKFIIEGQEISKRVVKTE